MATTGSVNGSKRQEYEHVESERPTKRLKGLLEQEDTSDEGSVPSNDKGVPARNDQPEATVHGFKVNFEYARRFEHNKKREELHKLQEKYGNNVSTESRPGLEPNEDDSDGTGSSTDSEEEDDEGVLASEALDNQIQDTLEAIRRKDPRVYDEKAKFFTDLDDEAENTEGLKTIPEKPMYLSDYHRRNLLEGPESADVQDDGPMSYAQQQDDLKTMIVKEMHAGANKESDSMGDESGDDESNDEFLVRKPSESLQDNQTARFKGRAPKVDVETADKDPETFLSNFMSARAWVPGAGTTLQPFESDDEEEDYRAELFEEAYNLRFEDPSNKKLLSHARDAAAKYSVRKESTNPRKKAREAEQAKKEAARQARDEEKARYRKLKVAEAEEKIRKIKDAAGLRGKSLQENDWSAFLDEGWDDERWEREMQKRFGDDYYADHDSDDSNEVEGKSKRKIKKPKWEDDIEIDDLVPDFDAAEHEKPQFSLTDDEFAAADEAPVESNECSDSESVAKPKSKPKSNKKRGRDEHKKEARLERRKIEQLVDGSMKVDETLSNFGKKHAGRFRYRETSPTAYGLTPHDILMASDSQLNQFAGLKRMAAFRDSDKKRKDKKRLGKKARLRQWRKETFGNEQGPQKTLAAVLPGQGLADHKAKLKGANGSDIREEKSKTRSRKSKPYST